MNPDLVTGIKVAKHPLMMTTNAGSKVIGLKGHGNGFGKVYYDPTSMANIFGLAQLADKYRVTFDSEVENAFVVHVNDRVVKFARTPEGLYAYKPSDRYLAEVAESKCMNPPDSTDAVTDYRGKSFLISSVEENRKGYTQCQFDDARWKNYQKEKNYCTIHESEPEDTEGYKTGFRIWISSLTER
ncbi:MAG: hypothetical protein ACP5NR_08700 [Athalassotoga sp.]|uniref:hypothetical protein n=1 Tax=Athalassotoga sp. TaxID=2022597 RepID=UPI003D012353